MTTTSLHGSCRADRIWGKLVNSYGCAHPRISPNSFDFVDHGCVSDLTTFRNSAGKLLHAGGVQGQKVRMNMINGSDTKFTPPQIPRKRHQKQWVVLRMVSRMRCFIRWATLDQLGYASFVAVSCNSNVCANDHCLKS